MAFALRHRVHLLCVASLLHLRCCTGSDRPDRTLLEGEGRAGSRASPQLQSKPSVRRWWLAEVPIAVPPATLSAQRCAGVPVGIAIEVGVPLPQQLLGLGVSAERRPRRKSQGRVMPPSTCQTPKRRRLARYSASSYSLALHPLRYWRYAKAWPSSTIARLMLMSEITSATERP